MNGWDMIAGTKQKKINELLRNIPNIPVSFSKDMSVFGQIFKCQVDVLLRSPEIHVKDVSGRQVDVIFPISGVVTMGEHKVEIPDQPHPQSLIATIQLTQVESELQDRQEKNQTKYDFILNLKDNVIVNMKYEGANAPQLAVLNEVLRLTLIGYVANHHKFKIMSFHLNSNASAQYQELIPSFAEYTFIRDKHDEDNSNILLLIQTTSHSKGNIFFPSPILPADQDFTHMVNNHLFLREIIFPELVKKVKEHARNPDDVLHKIGIVPNDETHELWSIMRNGNIDLDKGHDSKIHKLVCRIDQKKEQLEMFIDVTARQDLVVSHMDCATWNMTWLNMQISDHKLSINKADEHNGHSPNIDWLNWVIAFLNALLSSITFGIIHGLTAVHIPSLQGTFDDVAKKTIEWPYQQGIYIVKVMTPGHIIFSLNVKT